ncbi:MAG: protein kinase [Anaerolineales bacterium]|nr:protein kinase [Anaerolineales bacterium]
MAFVPGGFVGPYQILEKLGQGGMATVFKAYHPALDRHVAIKVLHPAFKEDPHFLERFQREARVVAKFEHPNIVPIYDFAEHKGQPYLVMKFIEGETLKARLSKEPLSKEEGTEIIVAVGDALDYAHELGVLHRDIKPSNILISTDGRIYLTDFGLARIAEVGASTISGDMLMGTPQYISPEQAKGDRKLDKRTDIYSFGIVIYEICVGKVPYSADTPFSIIHDHIYAPLPLPQEINPNVPSDIQRLLLKALAKNREDRYSSTKEMIQAYSQALEKTEEEGREELEVAELVDEAETQVEEMGVQDDQSAKMTVERLEAMGILMPSKRKSRMRWVWLAVGITMVCVSLLAILAAANRPGVRTLFYNNVNASGTLRPDSEGQSPLSVDQARGEVEKNPEDPVAHLNLASALREQGEEEEAISEFKIAGELFLHQDQSLDAAEAFFDAVELEGGPLRADPTLQDLTVQAMFFTASSAEAKPLLDFATRRYPGWDDIKIISARHMLYNNQADKAKQVIDAILQRNPNDPIAKIVMVEIHINSGRNEAAQNLIEEIHARPFPDWMNGQLDNLASELEP